MQVREAYLGTLKDRLHPDGFPDLLALMADAVSAMQAVIQEKIRLFGSSARAHP
jgi:tagatose 1,6-diphosphate aldolase GatY/KbaY